MSFPLQSLPDPALKHIFCCMTPLELIAISVLSTELSGLVKSLKISADRLDVILEENVTIEGVFQNGRLNIHFPNADPDVLDEKPRDINIYDRFDYMDLVWVDPGVKLRTYLKHASQIFNYSNGIDIMFWPEQEVLNMEALSKCFVSVNATVIGYDCSVEYAQKILKYFGPVTKSIHIYDDLFRGQSSSLVQSFAISNNDKFRVPDIRHGTLENLLTFNAEFINIRESSFPQVAVNRFIKLWMKGCNPRLKKFNYDRRMGMENELCDRSVVLKGIKYKKVRKYVERTVGKEVIKGGYDIKSRDGRRATVLFHEYKFINTFSIVFYVWD